MDSLTGNHSSGKFELTVGSWSLALKQTNFAQRSKALTNFLRFNGILRRERTPSSRMLTPDVMEKDRENGYFVEKKSKNVRNVCSRVLDCVMCDKSVVQLKVVKCPKNRRKQTISFVK